MWPGCPALLYRPCRQRGGCPAVDGEWVWTSSTTPWCQAGECMPAHTHHRRELVPYVPGKMWCGGTNPSAQYGTARIATKMWPCWCYSICTHTLTYTPPLCMLKGKIQLLVCLGDLWGQCRHVQKQQNKKIKKESFSYFKPQPRIFLLNSFKCSFLQRANKCMSWLQSLQSDVKRGTNNSLWLRCC